MAGIVGAPLTPSSLGSRLKDFIARKKAVGGGRLVQSAGMTPAEFKKIAEGVKRDNANRIARCR